MASARNIFVCYSLDRPEKGGDDKVRETIEAFKCSWAKLGPGVFYLHGEYDAQYVGNKVWGALSMGDTLVVIDSTNNDARWFNINPDISQFIMDNWHA